MSSNRPLVRYSDSRIWFSFLLRTLTQVVMLIEGTLSASVWKDKDENCQIQLSITADALEFINTGKREGTTSEAESPTDAASNVPVPPVAMPQEDKEDFPF